MAHNRRVSRLASSPAALWTSSVTAGVSMIARGSVLRLFSLISVFMGSLSRNDPDLSCFLRQTVECARQTVPLEAVNCVDGGYRRPSGFSAFTFWTGRLRNSGREGDRTVSMRISGQCFRLKWSSLKPFNERPFDLNGCTDVTVFFDNRPNMF